MKLPDSASLFLGEGSNFDLSVRRERASGGSLFEKSAAKTFAELVRADFASFCDKKTLCVFSSAQKLRLRKESKLSLSLT